MSEYIESSINWCTLEHLNPAPYANFIAGLACEQMRVQKHQAMEEISVELTALD